MDTSGRPSGAHAMSQQKLKSAQSSGGPDITGVVDPGNSQSSPSGTTHSLKSIIDKGRDAQAVDARARYEHKKAEQRAYQAKITEDRLSFTNAARNLALQSRVDVDEGAAKLIRDLETNFRATLESSAVAEICERVYVKEDIIASAYERQIKDKARAQLVEDLEPVVIAELSDKYTPEVKKQLKVDLKPKIERELWTQCEQNLREKLKVDLAPKIRSELRTEYEAKIYDDLKAELEPTVKEQLRAELQGEVRNELKHELEPLIRQQMELENRCRLHGVGLEYKTQRRELLQPDASDQHHSSCNSKSMAEKGEPDREESGVFESASEHLSQGSVNKDHSRQVTPFDHVNLKSPSSSKAEANRLLPDSTSLTSNHCLVTDEKPAPSSPVDLTGKGDSDFTHNAVAGCLDADLRGGAQFHGEAADAITDQEEFDEEKAGDEEYLEQWLDSTFRAEDGDCESSKAHGNNTFEKQDQKPIQGYRNIEYDENYSDSEGEGQEGSHQQHFSDEQSKEPVVIHQENSQHHGLPSLHTESTSRPVSNEYRQEKAQNGVAGNHQPHWQFQEYPGFHQPHISSQGGFESLPQGVKGSLSVDDNEESGDIGDRRSYDEEVREHGLKSESHFQEAAPSGLPNYELCGDSLGGHQSEREIHGLPSSPPLKRSLSFEADEEPFEDPRIFKRARSNSYGSPVGGQYINYAYDANPQGYAAFANEGTENSRAEAGPIRFTSQGNYYDSRNYLGNLEQNLSQGYTPAGEFANDDYRNYDNGQAYSESPDESMDDDEFDQMRQPCDAHSEPGDDQESSGTPESDSEDNRAGVSYHPYSNYQEGEDPFESDGDEEEDTAEEFTEDELASQGPEDQGVIQVTNTQETAFLIDDSDDEDNTLVEPQSFVPVNKQPEVLFEDREELFLPA